MRLARQFGLALALIFLAGSTAFAETHAYKLYVDGLACPFCAYGVEKRVGQLPGVNKVEIDIDGGVVWVTVEKDATISEDAAKTAVSEAGFTLRKFEAPRKGS